MTDTWTFVWLIIAGVCLSGSTILWLKDLKRNRRMAAYYKRLSKMTPEEYESEIKNGLPGWFDR